MAHKEIQRQNTIDEIKCHARNQMKNVGLSGISLSAISRSMEISAPALYRYFDSREDLIRALIEDALENFVSALQKAENGFPPADFARRIWAVILEYREWALVHPTDFQQIFNNPYFNDQTVKTQEQARIRRIFRVLLQILWDAYRVGKLRPLPEDAKATEKVEFGGLNLVENQDVSIPAPVMYTGLVVWSRIHGLVMLELALGINKQGDALGTIFRQEAAGILKNIGLEEFNLPDQPDDLHPRTAIKRFKRHAADDLHVVFGSGPLGLAVMRELLAQEKQVRMINRSGKAEVPEGVEWMVGDAFQVEFTRKACQNAVVVYMCAQPTNGIWLDRFAALNAAILDGAAAKGAKFIYGDNLLVYGAVEGPIHESLANKPQTRKGQIRARVSETVLTAHRSGRVRVAIGRGSDFFGPHVLDGVLGERFIAHLLRGKSVAVVGNPEMPHTYTFIEDFGKALVELGEKDEASGQIWHVPSSNAIPQRQFLEMFAKEAGLPLIIHGLGRPALAFKSLFSSAARDKLDVFYQFEKPFIIDTSKFEKTFRMTATPLAEAVRQTLNWYRENQK